MHHVAVGTTAEREVKPVMKPAEVGEGIVLAVVEGAVNVADGDLRRGGGGLKRAGEEDGECGE
jgi:hypothetical protein